MQRAIAVRGVKEEKDEQTNPFASVSRAMAFASGAAVAFRSKID